MGCDKWVLDKIREINEEEAKCRMLSEKAQSIEKTPEKKLVVPEAPKSISESSKPLSTDGKKKKKGNK